MGCSRNSKKMVEPCGETGGQSQRGVRDRGGQSKEFGFSSSDTRLLEACYAKKGCDSMYSSRPFQEADTKMGLNVQQFN